jgi:hypothetical protein
MGCSVTDDTAYSPSAPQIEQVTLSHEGGDTLTLSVDFVHGVPPPPRTVVSRYGPIDAPGSLELTYLIHPSDAPADHVIAINSPSLNRSWHGDVSEWDPSNPETIKSVSNYGNTLNIVLDLAGQQGLVSGGQFNADVHIVEMQDALDAQGLPTVIGLPSPRCNWDTPVGKPDRSIPVTQRAPQPQYAPPPPAWTSASPAPAPAPLPEQTSLPDADAQGFLSYPEARCKSTNPAVAVARTAQSAVVICQTGVGRFYYRGFGLQNGLSVEIDDPARNGTGFVVTNNGVQYSVTPDALTITQGSEVLSREPTLEYWQQ